MSSTPFISGIRTSTRATTRRFELHVHHCQMVSDRVVHLPRQPGAFMLMGAGTSGEGDFPHTHRASPDWWSFWKESTEPKYELYLPEGKHFSFVDHRPSSPRHDEKVGIPDWTFTGTLGTVEPERSVPSQSSYVAAFFDRHLRDG